VIYIVHKRERESLLMSYNKNGKEEGVVEEDERTAFGICLNVWRLGNRGWSGIALKGRKGKIGWGHVS
jgi:hypothetical protein